MHDRWRGGGLVNKAPPNLHTHTLAQLFVSDLRYYHLFDIILVLYQTHYARSMARRWFTWTLAPLTPSTAPSPLQILHIMSSGSSMRRYCYQHLLAVIAFWKHIIVTWQPLDKDGSWTVSSHLAQNNSWSRLTMYRWAYASYTGWFLTGPPLNLLNVGR